MNTSLSPESNSNASSQPQPSTKRVYVAPSIADVGSISSLTRGNPGSNTGDANGMMNSVCL